MNAVVQGCDGGTYLSVLLSLDGCLHCHHRYITIIRNIGSSGICSVSTCFGSILHCSYCAQRCGDRRELGQVRGVSLLVIKVERVQRKHSLGMGGRLEAALEVRPGRPILRHGHSQHRKKPLAHLHAAFLLSII